MKKAILLILFFTACSAPFAQNNNLLGNRFRLAQSYERAHKFKEAKSIYSELHKIQPWNFQYMSALNNVYLELKDYEASINLLNTRIEANPADINLNALLGKTYYTMGNYEKAFDIWNSSLDKVGNNPVNYRIIANAAIEMRAFDEAIEILKSAKEKYAGNEMFLFDLANLYTVTMNYRGAVDEYCSILLTHPQNLSLVKNRLSQILGNHGAVNVAENVIRRYFEKTEDRQYLNLLAFVYFQTKQFKKAFEVNKRLEEDFNGNGSGMYTFAQTAYREDEIELAVKAFRYVIDRYPQMPVIPNAKLGYAKTLEKSILLNSADSAESWKPIKPPKNYPSSKFNEAINSYKELLKYYSSPSIVAEVYFRIGSVYKDRLNNTDSSTAYFIRCIEQYPGSQFAFNSIFELGEQYMEAGKIKKASAEFNKLIKMQRAERNLKSKAQIKLSRINFWLGRFGEALEGLGEISKNLSDDNVNDALQLSMLITTMRKDSLTLLDFARADMFAVRSDYKEALKIYLKLSDKENLLIWNSFARYKAAEIFIVDHKLAEAESALKSISKDEKPSLVKDKALFLLGKLYQFGLKEEKKAIGTYQKLLENFPNSLYLDKVRVFINSIQT